MRKIEKIEIKNYRSIKTETIYDIKDLNVFSGCNDVGKSNVLRALDMFFNEKTIDFQDEFNIDRKSDIQRLRQKQIISVKITFRNDSYASLPSTFFVKKTWDKTGKMIPGLTDDIETRLKQEDKLSVESYVSTRSRASLSMFLNKFKFRYIPAIKDNSCFNLLLFELYNAIVENTLGSAEELELTLYTFNNKLAQLSEDLSNRFFNVSGIRSMVAIPTTTEDLARRMAVSTFAKEECNDKIPLFNRGDGIRMHYIPSILNFISSIEKGKWHIWAIDEPETSCEYSKSAKLAEDFKAIYCKDNQVFIATHSFHFISLKGDGISRYRVFNNNGQSTIRQVNKNLFEDGELKSELGVFSLLEGLQEVYDKYKADTNLLETNKNIVNSATKPLLIFEGESDRILFKKALAKLYPNKAKGYQYSEPADNGKGGSVIGEGVNSLAGFLSNHIPKIGEIVNSKKIIAIFDNDKEGTEQFNKLAKEFSTIYDNIVINGIEVLKHKNYSVYIFKLIPPDFRTNFVHNDPKHCCLSTEILLPDNCIPTDSRDIVPDTNPQRFSFKGNNKIEFAKRINETTTDFSGFQKTIDMIIYIENMV
jgi:predicted ATP-dependent endonuclease of OLD family